MKRCPECRRDYSDDTLLYCLEDGTALIQGSVPAPDEPQTAILHETAAPNEAATRAHIHTTEQTAVLSSGIADIPKGAGFDKRLFMVPLALAVIVLGGVFGYRYVTQAKQIESIAVMPFVNESGNADVEYLSDGMTETLIKSLSGLPELDVKPRSAVFRYKGKEADLQTIGKELNVQAVLNGRVAQRGDRIALSLELVDVHKNRVIWTEQYNRQQLDLVSLQSEIAHDVSSKVKAKLSGADETKITKSATANPEAYQAYLKGRFYWNRRTAENVRKAIEQFKIAVDKDPNYALGYAGLGDCYAVLGQYSGTPSSENAPQAKAHAERAIAIDATLAEPHATLATVHRQLWEWAEAEKEFKRAIELDPNYPTTHHWYSLLLKELGRTDEAERVIKRARELDPLSSVIGINVAETYQSQHKHDEAIEILHRVLELDPSYSGALEDLAISYALIGRHTDAIAAVDKAVQLTQRSGITLSTAGFVYAAAGKRTEALGVIKELETKYSRKEASGFDVATVYCGLGEKDKAFEWLEKDFRSRNGYLQFVRWLVVFEPLRDDPRFKDLLRRMNLPE